MRFHARLIGEFALTDDQGRTLLPTTRKTRALIARLLLAGGKPVPRSALIEFCWGDREIEQGRASLRQALYEARALTAEAALLRVSKTAVRADITVLESDLGLLITAARDDELATVAKVVAQWSPLLADCDGIAVQIDVWLAAERRLQADLVCAEIGAAVTRALDKGLTQDCSRLISFLAAKDPAFEGIGDYRRKLESTRRSPSAAGRMRGRAFRAALGLGCAAVLIALAAHQWSNAAGSRLIAVEPLNAVASDSAAQVVRSELSGDLVHALAGNPARMQVLQVDGANLRPGSTAFLISGDVATLGGQLRAHLQLSNARDRAILWAGNFSGDPPNADALGEQIATKADAVINCGLSTRHTGTTAIGDEASRLYLSACDLIEQFRLNEALQPLRQVTRLAPTFARAWADLATTEALTAADLEPADQAAAYREAAANAHRALALDPSTGLAYYALARTMPGIGNWQRRVTIIIHGLRAEPDGSELNNAMAEELLRVGRSREAIAYYRRSMASDPLNPVKTATLVAPLAFDGRLDEADTLIDQASRTWPHNPLIWGETFLVQMKVGDPNRAAAMLDDPERPEDRDADRETHDRMWLRARMNPTDANIAAALSDDLAKIGAESGTDSLPVVLNLAELGRVEAAYRLASKMGGTVDEDYDRLLFRNYLARFRADPRFMTLAAHRGLVSIWRATGRWPDFCVDHAVPYNCRAAARAL